MKFERSAITDVLRTSDIQPKSDLDIGEKPGVFVIVPRGEAIRNFVYSGAIDRLADGSRLNILTVAVNNEFTDLLQYKSDSVFPLTEYYDRWIVRVLREIIDVTHNRWIWTRAAQERSRLRDQEARTFREKVFRGVKKVIAFAFASRSGLNILTKAERTVSKYLGTTNEYLDLYQKTRPSLVFNASHVHSRNATQAVEAAQWLGIPTATFIFSWDNLTSQGRIMLPYDYFIVWNDTLKQQLLEMYQWIEPANVVVTGTPQFDTHFWPQFYLSREEYCEQIGADPNRPLVLYTTGMANHMPGCPKIVEGIADMLLDFPEEHRPQLLLRVYAKDLTGRFEDLRARRKDIIFIDPIWEPKWLTPKQEDAFALVNALRHCSVGINVASTVSLELCIFDKPVINVGYNPPDVTELSYADYYEFDHYKPVVDSGAIQVAYSPEEMRRFIGESLRSPGERKQQRRDLIDKMFGSTLDGKSGIRVADALLEIAKRGHVSSSKHGE